MATQKVRPDQDRDEQQRVQRRQVSRIIKAGTLAIAAIVGAIAVLIAVVAVGPGDQNSATPVGGGGIESAASSTAAPGNTTIVGSKGLLLENATPSKPPRGKLVRWKGALEWDGFLYADGRWIYSDGSKWVERRLTARGVRLLRSAPQPVHPEWLPASAWEDRNLSPYVPSRYMVVATSDYLFGGGPLPRPPVKHELPSRVQELLRRGDRIVGSGLELTTDEARTLAQVLSESGFEPIANPSVGLITYSSRLFGIDINQHSLVIEFHVVLPDGRVPSSK
jgi:hypothetical protein